MKPTSDLIIVHTNDFHNRLQERHVKRLVDLRRSIDGRGLLLDAGDAGGSGNITYRRSGEPILEQFSLIGYDLMTVGNRDFHLLQAGFCSKVRLARFPVLCANVRSKGSPVPNDEGFAGFPNPIDCDYNSQPYSPRLPVVPFVVRCLASCWTVLVIGLTVPMITDTMWERKISAFVFEDPLVYAERMIPKLRQYFHPHLVIALTHIGLKADRALASAVPEIDLIVGGHSHSILEQGERVGNTLIVQAGCYGEYVGIVEIEAPDRSHPGLAMRARLETL